MQFIKLEIQGCKYFADKTTLEFSHKISVNKKGIYAVLCLTVLILAKANVGQKSYSVIGQGMIDQIFALTPEARKNFFDEATGVKEYQIKRDQAILKINHTRENLKEVEIQLAEIEPRLRSLTRQKKRLEERAEVEKTLRELQRIHFTNIYNELENLIDSLNGKKRVKENEINAE